MRWSCLPALLLLCSCVTDRWDTYDNSSYDVIMEPSDTEYEEHVQLLESWAADGSQPMPPGLYAELGYWLAKLGRYEAASAAFDQELARYPYAEKYLATLTMLVLEATTDEQAKPSEESIDEPADEPADPGAKSKMEVQP